MSETIVVALIGLVGTMAVASFPILVLVVKRHIDLAASRVTVKNTDEHLINKAVLDDIKTTVEVIQKQSADNGRVLRRHLDWHLGLPVVGEEDVA